MAISTRSVRQFGSVFQNQLEAFGLNTGGDSIAAARLGFSLGRAAGPVPVGDEPVIAPQAPGGTPVFTVNGDPTQLGAGRAAIISYETDTSAGGSPDALRIVLLDSLAAGGVIYITDRAWNGSSFAAAGGGEGTYTFTAGGNLAAGTVITLSAAQLSSAGITLSNAGETIYLYQGTGVDAPTRFLFAADIADGNTTFNGSLANTGLTNGVNAVAVASDNAVYNGSTTQIPQTQLADISTTARWFGTDTDDNPGTPNYTEVLDTTIGNAFNNPDMVIIAGMAGGGQSDAILRIGNDTADGNGVNFSRLFRDNPAFNHITDVTFDLEDGFFFFVDSDGNSINRIMRGNIADLVSGNSTPTFTQIFATDGLNNGVGPFAPGELITGIEIDKASNKIYWWDGDLFGDFEGGWQLYKANYDGTGLTLVTTLDTENADPNFGFPGGMGDWALDLGHGTAGYAYAVSSTSSVDGLGNATLGNNHIIRVDLATGVITVLALGAADPRTNTGPGGIYNDGRLDPAEGQIIALDVDRVTGIVYFITQPISASDTSGVWSYNPATDTLVELWQQPSNNAFNTLQSFPTANMTHIEVDEIGGRIYISATSDTDTENDGTPGTNESDAAIFSLAIGAAVGTAPTLLVRVYEPTANGAPQGMEIDYAPITGITSLNATYTESTNGPGSPAGPVVTPFNNATVSDADTTVIQSATVAITSGFVSGDTLSFTNSGGITGSYNASTGVVTFTGAASAAAYQTIINSIRFTNAGDNPTNYGYNTSRTISVTAFDGLLNSDPATATINIVGINDAPVNTVPGAQAATEDTAKVITGISIADPDADPAAQNITVTFSVTNGTVTLLTNVAGGIIAGQITAGANGSNTVTVTATQNQINATLAANGLSYLNIADYNGSDTLTITTNDNGLNGNDPGLTGTGTSEQDQDTVTINIAAVVDIANDNVSVAEDSGANTLNVLANDTFENPARFISSVTQGAHGTVTINDNGTAGDKTDDFIVYTVTDANYNGSDTFQYTVTSPAGITETATVNVTVTAVNDPITTNAPATLTLNEDAVNVAVAGLSIADVDATLAPAGVYNVTLAATNGTVTMSTLAGLTFTAGDGTADATMTFHGTLAAINAALATTTYTPTANYNGAATITLSATDTFGGIVATGTGVATNDSDIVNVTVNAINDAPVNTVPGTQTINEDATLTFSGGTLISIADIDANGADVMTTVTVLHGTLTVGGNAGLTSLTGDGTGTVVIVGSVAEVNNALNGLIYAPAANYNGSDTLTITTNDGGNTGAPGPLQDQDTVTINITAINDTPVVAVQASVASTEQVAAKIDPAATITDVELGARNGGSGDYSGSVLTVGRNGGPGAQDLLNFAPSGAFTVNGGNLEAPGGLVFATYTGGNGSNLVITFTSSGTPATQALVNAVVQSLQYTYTGDTPPASITMNYSFNDGAPGNAGQGGGGSPLGTDSIVINITDTPENIAPTLDLDGNDSTVVGTGYVGAFTEGGAAVAIVDSDVSIIDPDAGDLIEGATIAINGPVAGDVLTLAPQGGFTITGSGTTTITISGTGTAAQYQTMLALITFNNTSEDPGTVRTINIRVTDGTDTSNVAVSTINITPFNDEPTLTATGANATLTEGGAAVDLFSAVTASTIESGQTFTSLTLTVTNVTDGAFERLSFDGSTVALTNGNVVVTATNGLTVNVSLAGSTATVAFSGASLSAAALQTLVDGLTYNNTSESPTDANRVVTITQLVDSGANGGGNDNVANPNISATVNVDPVNDAPVVDLNGAAPGTSATLNYTENQALTSIAPGAVSTDVDNANYSGGQLRITITNGLNGEDVLSVVNQGTGAGQIGFNGSTVTYEGTAIGFFGPTGPGPVPVMFIILNGANVSSAAVNALLGAIGYRNTSENPSTTPRTVEFALFDPGPNVQTGFANATINVTSVNDAPFGTDKAVTINEDAPYTFATADFGFSDPSESHSFLAVKFTTLPTNGTLFYDADGAGGAAPVAISAGQFVAASEIALGKVTFVPNANANGTPLSSFTFQVQDNGGTANGGVDLDQTPNTFTINVSAVNDAPVITTTAVSVLTIEDNGFNFSGARVISVSDVDATTLTVTLTANHGTLSLSGVAGLSFSVGDGTSDATMTFSGTAASINTALNNLRYDPTANYNGFDIVQINVSDNGQTGTGGTQTANRFINVTIDPVNDAPAGTDNTLTGSEDDPVVFTAADFGFTDPNDSPANSLLAVKITTLPALGTLFLDADGPGGAAPVAVVAGQFISVADINAGHFYFLGAPDGYGSPYANFQFQVQDNGGTANGGVNLDPTTNLMSINLTPDNLPPVVDLNGGGAGINYSTSYTEDSPAIAITSGATVIDQDTFPNGGSLVSMTVTLTDRVAGDSLAFGAPLPGGFSAVVTSAAGSITIVVSGTGTGAQYASILNSIVYQTSNQDPTVSGTDPARTITVTVNDGQVDSAVATTTINVIAVDDLPVAQPDAFTITESGTINGASLFANNGSGPDTDPDGPALSISAVNGSGANVGSQITLASGALLTVNANGTFSYNPNGAFDSTPTTGSGASNTPAHDSFTYTLAGGNTVTVTITLTGLDTNDILFGTAGADVLIGGIGNDTYFVGDASDQVVEAVGGGNDTVYASTSYALNAGAEVEILATTNAGGNLAIALTGNEFGQTIIGNAGNNFLSGGGGADILDGGAGNDVIIVDTNDLVIEAVGGGNDLVASLTNYLLNAGAEVETLSTTNAGSNLAIALTGNEFGQLIIGNAGNNFLSGGGGADTLDGGAGNDVIIVDTNDLVIEAVGGGNDLVAALTSYVLNAGAEVETLSTTNAGSNLAIALTGNEFGQTIIGNAGNNFLSGGGGTDIFHGLGGNDTYSVDSADDLVFENVGEGNDTVLASTSYTLAAGQEIESLLASNFGATTPLNLTGNEFANTIYGNDGNNILDGKGGNDLLIGQGGADTFAFTTALGANNVDVIFGFTHGTDKIALDHGIFTQIGGLGALNAGAFVVGPAAADGTDRIIYNNLTGQLFYDADGTGAGAAIQFATLSPGLTLTASDFLVI